MIELEQRVEGLDWPAIEAGLEAHGVGLTGALLTPAECVALAGSFDGDGFRKHIVMQSHGYGQGEYKYCAYPLPPVIATLRRALYARLAPIANRWAGILGGDQGAPTYPERHEAFLARCHEAGQDRPTPLLLRYGVGDYNRLHQDLYGALAFPMQAVLLLSQPGEAFTGGELVLTEQRARMQSRAEVVSLGLGEAAIIPVSRRPVTAGRGRAVVTMRHGVSRLRSGSRLTLGVIFHDAA